MNTLVMCIKTCPAPDARDGFSRLRDAVKQGWQISIIGLMALLLACGSSPIEDENQEQNVEQPDLKNMVLIPAGEFLMGSPECEGAFDEHPQHIVYLDDFYIDKYEVTNAQFKEFVEATGYVTDAERGSDAEVWNPKSASLYWLLRIFRDNEVNWRRPNAWAEGWGHPKVWENYNIMDRMNYPVVQVSWDDAQHYAAWAGKRLPTEAEWEKAARGIDGRKWPWGNVFNLDIKGATIHANIASEDLVPVVDFSSGISPYGVYNMAGNAQEWVADWYAEDYYIHGPLNNPKGPDNGNFRCLRGGSWRHQKSYHVSCASREY
jgi:formylglycine-generating enzyme required for sulfatase activity